LAGELTAYLVSSRDFRRSMGRMITARQKIAHQFIEAKKKPSRRQTTNAKHEVIKGFYRGIEVVVLAHWDHVLCRSVSRARIHRGDGYPEPESSTIAAFHPMRMIHD
jgi:folate-dependent phosphoribosylglycinamide formyltransferase PurN